MKQNILEKLNEMPSDSQNFQGCIHFTSCGGSIDNTLTFDDRDFQTILEALILLKAKGEA